MKACDHTERNILVQPVLSDYVPDGAKWQHEGAHDSFTTRSGWYVKSLLQYEHISSFPLFFAGARNDLLASVEIGFIPGWAAQNRGPHTQNDAREAAEPVR